MKRRKIAMLLAAMMSVTSIAQATAISAAEFTDVEVFEAPAETDAGPVLDEEPDVEDNAEALPEAETPTEAEDQTGNVGQVIPDETQNSDTEVFGEPMEDSDLFTAPELDAPDSVEDLFATDGTEEEAGGIYEVAYITQEQYESCLQRGDRPEAEYTSVEGTLSSALTKIEGTNTGYCVVVPTEIHGFEDLVIPEGLNVFLAYAEDARLRSITPNGNITFWGPINTPGALELKEGKGRVSIDGDIDGVIVGSGADDTIVFTGDGSSIGGLQGVENVVFQGRCGGLNVFEGGSLEFYNIVSESRENSENPNVWVNIEGYSQKSIPVFHQDFDLGKCHDVDEEGNQNEWDACVAINYTEDFDVEEWKGISLKEGDAAVKFAADDAEALKIMQKLRVDQGDDFSYAVDIDGTTLNDAWSWDDTSIYHIQRMNAAGDYSAEEIFERYGRAEHPDDCFEQIPGSKSLKNVLRILTADSQSSEGYYVVYMPKEAGAIKETLTVPDGVKGIVYEAFNDWDEENETTIPHPVTITSVNVPAGKILGILGNEMEKKAGTLTIRGEGEARIIGGILRQKIDFSGADLRLSGAEILGDIQGSGADDTLIFDEWSRIQGLHGVENVKFKNSNNIESTAGQIELYNIENDPNFEDANIVLNIEGYAENRIPVFHKDYDLGMNSDDEGNTWEAGVGIHYVKDFNPPEGQDWEFMNPGSGKKAVKFEGLDDAAIIHMVNTMWLGGGGEEGFGMGIDIDGTLFSYEDSLFDVVRFQAAGDFTEEEIYDRWGKMDIPEDGERYLMATSSMKNAVRIMEADKKSNGGDGYYRIDLPKNYTIEGTLTVPAFAAGVIYCSRVDWDENGNGTYYPAKVSAIDVPKGKKLRLCDAVGNGATLKITGEGVTELGGCRLNQNITATNVCLEGTTVKSLVCDNLYCYSEMTVGEYLKFNTAYTGGVTILAKSGAVIDMGMIYNDPAKTLWGGDGNFWIFQEDKNGKAVYVHLEKGMELGTVTSEDGETYSAALLMQTYDAKKAAAAGVGVSKNIYSMDYSIYGENSKGENVNYFRTVYDDDVAGRCLMTFGESAAKLINQDNFGICYKYTALYPDKDAAFKDGWLPLLLEVWDPETEESKVSSCNAFVAIRTAKKSLSTATVSSIKDQIYTGKALKPSVTVKAGGKTLKEDTDYVLTYKNNKNIGTATVTITGKGDYVGKIQKTFNIIPKKGASYTVSGIKYKITKTASKNGTVSVTAPSKKTNTKITIPATVKIKGYTFKVTAIGNQAFKNNTKLKSVIIGSNVTTIGKEAFYGCKALKTITIKSSSLKTVGANAFKGINSKATIKVPASKLSAYKKLLKGKGQAGSVKITK